MRTRLVLTILLTTAAIQISTLSSVAQDTHFPSNEDLRHTRAISQPRLSPDAASVLLQVSDATADGGRTHLWLVDIKQNTSRQLTYSPASDKRGEHTQLYRLPMEGGEAHPYELKIDPPVDASQEADAIPPNQTKASQKPE